MATEPQAELPQKLTRVEKIAAPVLEDTGRIAGFLIPESYKRQSVYRHNVLFRSTLLILIATVLIGGSGGYCWMLASRLKKTAMATQALQVAEATRLQNQSIMLKGTRAKFKELEALRKQLRIPLAPILDAIEKTIPKSVSVNTFSMTCPPLPTWGTTRRRAQAQMTVFFPEGVEPTDDTILAWPDLVFTKLEESGLKGANPEWGPQKQYLKEMGKKSKEKPVKGWTRDVTFAVELGEN